MGILNGQPVDETYTNPAFLDRRLDDTAIGKYTLNNTEPVSGNSVENLQREHNSAASFIGKGLNSAKNDLPAWNNNQLGNSYDPLKDRIDTVTGAFDSTSGHSHNGIQGQGPRIIASTLDQVPLRGYVLQGTTLTSVSGLSVNVSTQLAGKTSGGSAGSPGVVTDSPFNQVVLRQATGANQGDSFVDSLGNVVYGRVTYAATIWTLTFYVLTSGTETSYTFGSAVNIAWYYQEIFNPMISAPTYSEFAVIPSDNVTADVITATQSLQGKVLLSSTAPPDISTTAATGTPNATVALADHTHKGLHSLAKFGSVQLFGDVTLTGSSSTVLTQIGQNINIDTQGAIGHQEVPYGPVNGVNTTFGPLTYYPSSVLSVLVFIDSIVVPNSEWTLVGNSIVFTGIIPQLGQQVFTYYLYAGIPTPPPVPQGAFNLEYRTLTSLEVTNKVLNLINPPAVGSLTVVDLINAGPQVFGVDYSVAGTAFTWNGYALDGILEVGDILRVQYLT